MLYKSADIFERKSLQRPSNSASTSIPSIGRQKRSCCRYICFICRCTFNYIALSSGHLRTNMVFQIAARGLFLHESLAECRMVGIRARDYITGEYVPLNLLRYQRITECRPPRTPLLNTHIYAFPVTYSPSLHILDLTTTLLIQTFISSQPLSDIYSQVRRDINVSSKEHFY